ncbi:MAG: DnaJ like chaperone protein [Chloroflexota bacterium]|jgi:curved DNA-binding protein CbpA|nr:DnaJ like chaperone protein [Chloroflexota bacterium]
MPEPTFRGDPYAVLDVEPGASSATIKRRWRELAREHHPDRAAGAGAADAAHMTSRMARINAAYDLLRDPVRKARYDASPQARRARSGTGGATAPGPRSEGGSTTGSETAGGPPPPPPSRPVTARYDTTAAFHRGNATTSTRRPTLRAHPPADRRAGNGQDLRASTPTGPVRRRTAGTRAHIPSLEESRETMLEFGRFRGRTLAEVAVLEPTYVDWIAKTITRDRDLVVRARVIQSDLDARGIERQVRESRPGFGFSGLPDD